MTGGHPSSAKNDIGCYFARPAESLVLEGYRRWMAGFDTGSVIPWEMTWALYEQLLGEAEGRRAMAELGHFVRTLRRCAACPLKSFPFGALHVCRDECLTLGLIAAIQHGDDTAARSCLDAMTCPTRCAEVALAADTFAMTLKAMRQILVPIPQSAIADILTRSTRVDHDRTIH